MLSLNQKNVDAKIMLEVHTWIHFVVPDLLPVYSSVMNSHIVVLHV